MRHRALLAAPFAALPLLAACGSDAGTASTVPPPTTSYRTVDLGVAVDQDRAPISPYVYGSNQDDGTSRWTVRRYGGNRLTGYNWESNCSSAGSDYQQSSDDYLISSAGLTAADAAIPGRAITHFHDQSIAMGAQSIVTLQMAGYVAADCAGTVSAADVAPSRRWVRVEPRKGTAFSLTPDRTDGVVYMDELVNMLVQRYGGAASSQGVRWYSLDNEPALWSSTHPRIHPQPVGAAELVDRSIALASAVKAVDANARIIGPAAYGISEYVSLQDAPDWPAVKGDAEWFIDYYLARMRAAEPTAGRRLLDVLDVHYYPEAIGDHRITDGAATTSADEAARLQAPRTLWDASYHENSWVGQYMGAYLPLLPRLQRSIAQRYPGTGLAISEYDFGGGATISGGIAQADVLGILGRAGVQLATRWGIAPSDVYAAAGFKLYRDYDGQGGSFGNTSVRATTSDTARASVYASIVDADASVLHLILLNRDQHDTLSMRVRVTGGATYGSARAWSFGAGRPTIAAQGAVGGASATGVTLPVAPLTAVHLVLRTQ